MENLLCPWESAQYLIFSSNVPPLLHYSHFLAIFFALVFVIIIIASKNKTPHSRALLGILLLFISYSFLDLFVWASNRSDIVIYFWSIQIAIEVLIYLLSFYFAYSFLNKKEPTNIIKTVLVAVFAFFAILSPSIYALTEIDLNYCNATESSLIIISTYLIQAITIFSILIMSFLKIRKEGNIKKREIVFLLLGIIIFLLGLTSGNIVGSLTENWDLAQFGFFGMPIFIGFLTYNVVKFKTINLKLLGANVFVVALWIFLGVLLFVVQSVLSLILVSITTFLSIFFGILLIRSIKKEVLQREKLQELTKDLSIANEKLKSLDKLKTEFLSLAAHQLRSPLSAIKGYTSMLLEGSFGEMNENQKMTIDRIFQSSNHLSQVIEDLLNVSKIEQGGLAFTFDKSDLNELVSDVMTEGKINAEKQKLSLDLKLNESGNFFVIMDKEKIRQVITNLFDNAIKYTPQGGKITVGLEEKGSTVALSIKDDGMGVPPEILETLFQKFSRGEGAKMNTGGSGLGLYLAKKIVDGHKGKIWVESEGRGKGSTFFVELPKA